MSAAKSEVAVQARKSLPDFTSFIRATRLPAPQSHWLLPGLGFLEYDGTLFAAVMMTSVADTDVVLFPIGQDYDLDFKILHRLDLDLVF